MIDAYALTVVIACGATALAALVLSATSRSALARRLGRTSVWLALLAIPVALARNLFGLWSSGSGAAFEATAIGRAISNAMNCAALVLPSAMLAMLAIRRANGRRGR